MTDHETMRAQIFALYDGVLTGEPRRRAEAHLAACADCRALRDRWAARAKALFAAPTVEPSERFVQGVMARIRPAASPAPVVRPAWRPVLDWRWLMPALAAAAVVVVLVGRPAPASVSVDTVLMGEPIGLLAWAVSETPTTTDDVVEWTLGG